MVWAWVGMFYPPLSGSDAMTFGAFKFVVQKSEGRANSVLRSTFTGEVRLIIVAERKKVCGPRGITLFWKIAM